MVTAQQLRDRARVLRAQANDKISAEAALAARSIAAAYERRADELDAADSIKPSSKERPPVPRTL
jgi:hypothetical protein